MADTDLKNLPSCGRRRKGAQLNHLLLDVDFFDKPKIKGLIFRCGHEGGQLLIRLLLAMARSDGGALSRDAVEAVGYEMHIAPERLEEIVSYCLNHGILRGSLDELRNDRVDEDQKRFEVKRERWRSEKDRGAEFSNRKIGIFQPENGNFPTGKVVFSGESLNAHRCDTDTDTDSDLSSSKNTEEEGVQREEVPPLPSQPILSKPKLVSVPTGETASKSIGTAPKIDPPEGAAGSGRDNFHALASELLEPPAGQEWTRTNLHITAGRRPMRKSPQLYFTPGELAQIMRVYESEGVGSRLVNALRRAEAEVRSRLARGEKLERLNVNGWLLGYMFRDEISAANEITKKNANARRAQQ